MGVFDLQAPSILHAPRHRLPARSGADKVPFLRVVDLAADQDGPGRGAEGAVFCHVDAPYWWRAWPLGLDLPAMVNQQYATELGVYVSLIPCSNTSFVPLKLCHEVEVDDVMD